MQYLLEMQVILCGNITFVVANKGKQKEKTEKNKNKQKKSIDKAKDTRYNIKAVTKQRMIFEN